VITAPPLLEVEDVVTGYGQLRVVQGLSFTLGRDEILAVVGANGVGKTTLLNALVGLLPLWSGSVRLDGEPVRRRKAHDVVRRGIALVPEGRRLFPTLTVEENLRVAEREGAWGVERVFEAFPLLNPLRHKRAASLSGGEQQATAIGRALMTNPRLLLLDEVSLGLAPRVVDEVYASLASLQEAGTTMLLVEQDLSRALRVASRVVCMLEGRLVLEGAAGELSREQVTEAYFGLARAG
jgi:branched-chain amino acid transport system ATP-binding protein